MIATLTLIARSWNPGEDQEPGYSCTFEGVAVGGLQYGNVTSLNTVFEMAGIKQIPGRRYKVTIEERI